jgi:hypothetical protein
VPEKPETAADRKRIRKRNLYRKHISFN